MDVKDPSHGMSSSSKNAQVEVIVIPFHPMHSHLNQLLHLSCLLSAAYNLPVHFATTATHLRQLKLRFTPQTLLQQNPNLHFHEFPTPPSLSPPPTPNPSSRFPSHLLPSFDASLHLRRPVAELLREIAGTAARVVVIHDFLMAYVVQDVAAIPIAESYIFNPISAFNMCSMLLKDDESFLSLEELEGMPGVQENLPEEVGKFCALQADFHSLAAGTIFNSSRSIEGTYLDLLEKEMNSKNQKLWAVGPLNSVIEGGKRESNSQHRCLEWLDRQAPKSVLYVSFGTTTTMADEEIRELALGLEHSKQSFIWVLRDADKGDTFTGDVKRADPLPEGYVERVKEFGMVVRDWAPQVNILAHPSTGGFMSHCGWNSCLESITAGVPILAWPMGGDQLRNAFFFTDIVKVGLAITTWKQVEQVVTSATISEVIRTLMASRKGEEIRRKVEKMCTAANQAMKEGGVSLLELDSFITHITR